MAKERRKAARLPIVAARGLAAAVSIMMVLRQPGSLRVMILGVMCVAAIVCTNSYVPSTTGSKSRKRQAPWRPTTPSQLRLHFDQGRPAIDRVQ